jgi:hypothetical protein
MRGVLRIKIAVSKDALDWMIFFQVIHLNFKAVWQLREDS